MHVVKGAISIAVSLAVVAAVTGALRYAVGAGAEMHHPVFFYLLPIAVVAILCGAMPALLGAGAAALCAMYFLYEPIYSFEIAKTLEWGDLICFVVLAVIGIKCAVELARPLPAAKSRYERT